MDSHCFKNRCGQSINACLESRLDAIRPSSLLRSTSFQDSAAASPDVHDLLNMPREITSWLNNLAIPRRRTASVNCSATEGSMDVMSALTAPLSNFPIPNARATLDADSHSLQAEQKIELTNLGNVSYKIYKKNFKNTVSIRTFWTG